MIKITYLKANSDATYLYNVGFPKGMTVGDFIKEWLESRKAEWGYFGIADGKSIFGSPRCEYARGEIITEPLPAEILEKQIKDVSGSGGWTRSDFLFVV